jgi:hypothetical protein
MVIPEVYVSTVWSVNQSFDCVEAELEKDER